MNRADRAGLILEVAKALDAKQSSRDVDAILRVWGLEVPFRDQWGEGPDVSESLIKADDQALLEIARYLNVRVPEGAVRTVDTGLWGAGGLRVFISHLTAKKMVAKAIADELAAFGVKTFVAHEDVQPSREWAIEIMRALQTCHAMLALLSPGFVNSTWCDQEVGVALGRQVPIVPLKYEADPHGFIGAIQALPVANRTVSDVIPQVIAVLLERPETEREMGDTLASSLATASDAAISRRIAAVLPRVRFLSSSAMILLDESADSNAILADDKITHAAIEAILSRFKYKRIKKHVVPAAMSEEDIPF